MTDKFNLVRYEAFLRQSGCFDDELEKEMLHATREAGTVPRSWCGRVVFARAIEVPPHLELHLERGAEIVSMRLSADTRAGRMVIRRLAAADIQKTVNIEVYDSNIDDRPNPEAYAFVMQGHHLDVPPVFSATGNLVKSVFEGEDGHEEEAIQRGADPRIPEGGRGRHAGTGAVPQTRFQ